MKVLIAIVMFLFGVFVGILVVPTFQEFSTPMYVEEEYSSPRIKSLLHEFGITLPLEAADVNVFMKQEGSRKQLWVKFECSPEVKEAFIAQLNIDHAGRLNSEVESPKMFDGTMITWWSYSTSFRYYEFNGMVAAYDDIMRKLYIYASSDSGNTELSSSQSQLPERITMPENVFDL